MRKIVIGILSLFLAFNGLAQTPGLIYKPANAGQSVLDPNLDGYVSKTNQGFQGDDETDSEIAYVPLPVVGAGEPDGDNSAGPSCGFVDMVRSDDDETIYTYSDATNLHFRFRLGGTAENSKGYTILVDADQKFGATGPDADPDYTVGNPGFEYEITLRTNFGVSIYNIDNNTLTSTEIGDGTVDRPYDDFAQKAIAGSTICGPDYFYDFYVPYADLPYTSATPVRMVGGTTIAPKNSTGFKIADLGGVDDDAGITDDLFQQLIDVFPPTSGDDVSAGATIDPRAACPTITGPIAIGATSISGTTSEVDGATIEVFRDGVSQGTTLASGGAWTLSGISAAVANEVFTATAKVGETAATATGTKKKSTSYSTCNASTVGTTCSTLTGTIHCSGDRKIIVNSLPAGSTVKLYKEGTGFVGNFTQGTTTNTTYYYACNGNTSETNCNSGGGCGGSALDGIYYYTITESGKCESVFSSAICIGTTGTATTPTISTSPIENTTTSITGSATNGATVTLYVDGVSTGLSATASLGSYTISGISGLEAGQIVKVHSVEAGACPAFSIDHTVQAPPVQSAAPIITDEFCVDAATEVTSVSGISSEDAGSVITIYDDGSSTGVTTTVAANGSWTADVTGQSILSGSVITATAQTSGELVSDASNGVTVQTKTPDPLNALEITSSPAQGDASISGNATVSANDVIIQLYIDGAEIEGAFATIAGDLANAGIQIASWTITGLDTPFDKLYAEGVATVTARANVGTACESDPSAGVVIQCQPPDNSMTFAATSATTICAGETIDFSVSTTEDLIVYELVDQASNGVGPAALGDGNSLNLTTYGIDASVTSISLIAKRIGISCDETVGTISVSPEQINLTQVSTDPSGCATPDGTITLSGLTASESYTLDYTLDGVAVASSIINADGSGDYEIGSLGAGNYTDITISGTAVTLICDNVIAGPVVLSVPGAPVLTLGVETGPSTCSGADGSITFTSDELSSNYTLNYLLDGVAGSTTVSSDGTGTITGFAGLSAGVYSSVSITNTISECKSNVLGPFTLVDPDPTIFIAGSANPSACGGNGTINLGFTGFADGTYTIDYDGGSFAGVVVASNAATISAPAGSYANLSTTESATNCLTDEDPDVTLLDPATHTIAATKTNPTSCGGNGSINLTFTGVPDGTYVVDYDGGSFTGVVVASNSATIAAPAGTYSNLSLTLSGCVSAEFPDVTLTDPSLPVVTLTSSSDPTSAGGSDGSIVLGVSVADGTYSFDYHDGTTAQVFSGVSVSSNAATISGLSEGTYNDITITVNSCTSSADIDVVLTDPAGSGPDLTGLATSATDVCAGAASTVTVSATSLPDGAYTVNYTLTGDNAQAATDVAMTISGGTNSGTFNTPTLGSAGTTNLTINSITLSGNTTAASTGNTDAITVSALPAVTFTAQPGAAACAETDVTYTTQGGQSNYIWTFPGTVTTDYTIISGGTTSDNTVTLQYLTAGSKTVSVNYTNAAGCTAASATSSSATTVSLRPTVTFTAQPGANTCVQTDVTYTTQSGHSNYVWTFPGTVTTDYTITSGGTSTDNTVTLKYVTTGSKTVSVNYTSSGCTAASATSSNATTVDPASVGGSVAGSATVCTGTNSTTLTLSGHTGSVTKWQSSTSSDFSTALTDIANTTASLTATNLTATTYYRAVVQSGSCATANSSTGTVTVDPASVGGSIAGSATVCTGTNSTTLTLSGHTGSVTKWQSSTSSDFSTALTDIANTTASLTATNLTATTYYRAVVQSGSCATANSSTGTVTVDPASVGGSVAGSATVCTGTNSTTLTLSGHTGSVTKWQSSTSSDFSTALTDIANTTVSLTATNLTATTYYRAVVQSGSCATANSSTGTVTVDPASVGGSIAGSATVCTGTNSTTLTLSGHTGSVTKWQSSTSSDFSTALTDIANTTASLTATNLNATTYYRAVVQSGSCATANSSTATITVNPNPSITLATSPTVSQGTTSASLGYSATSNSPNQYTIDFDATAEGQGFVDVTTTALPSSPISITVPGAAAAQVYNATITVSNSTTTCSSSATAFTITVSSTPLEVCNNGIDDDGDGLIDCYDSDCYGVGACADFFYGQNTPTCFNPPAVLPTFTLEEVFRSDNVNSGFDQRSGVMVGDMDDDGIAEIVTHDRTDDEILIFSGLNGEIKQTISQNGGAHQFAMVALGDVDRDGLGDIFVTEGSNTNAVIRRYEYSASGNQTGTNNAIFTTAQLVGTRVNYSSPQLADFDEDGSPEVYVGANIFNAETGALLAQDNTINSGWLNTGSNNGDRLPIAYNIFDSGDARPAGAGGGTFGAEADGLEFVAGNRVYTVDGGAFQLAAEITGSNYGDGFVSLGDLDNDNEVDIIVTSEGYIFAWNPRTETGIGNIYDIPGTTSGGKANVGDFDNDGVVDIGFAGSNRYIVLQYNSGPNTLTVKWQKTGLDDGSQRTGSTLYDFEGDGIAEVVYSEEAYLYIYSGLDGSELTRIPSLAGTRVEYPLVADVNNDGQAEIIVTAQEGNGPGFSGADDYFVVYKSANSSWVSSREIWNQHGYHVTNINDDMTIPQYQQDIFHPQFGGSLNGFLVQTTYLDQGGEPTYATSDLVVTASSVNQNCASSNNGLDISMTIQNQGDWKAPRTTPITVYDADPYAGTANVIDTVHLPVTLEVGASRVLNTTVQDNGQDFTLYVLVNHNPYEAGTTDEIATPLAAGTTNTWVNECDYTNNSFSEAIINCNEEPVITDVNVSVDEDNTYTFAATDFSDQYTDAEGEPIDRIQITSLPSASAGILYLSGVAITANDEIDFADLANITFVPVADFDGDATFGWNAHDGTEYALAGAAVNIDIIPVNDAPLLTLDADNSGGGTDDDGFDVSYTEGDGVVAVLDATDASVSDIDDTQMSSLSITVGGLQDGDNEEIIIDGITFMLGSDNSQTSTIGGTTFQIAYVSGVFTISNNAGGDVDITDINSLLATIQYQHTDGANPTDGDRTLTFVTNDGDDNSASVVSTISLASVNDAPVAVDDPSNELVEDGNITISTIGANDTDADGTIEASTITLIDPSNPSNTGDRLSDLIIAGVGTYAVDISGNVTFTPESGFTGDASVNYTIEDNDGATSNTAEIGIKVITKPDITLGANPSVCEGATTASLSYSATAGGANEYSIDYSDAAFADVVDATLPASPIALVIPGGTSEGVYTATLTVSNSSNGYVSTSKSISITINDTPSIGATPSNPTTCSGSDGSIAISGVKNATTYAVSYTFNSTVVNTNITSGGAGNSLTITGLVEGTYTNISVTASGCSSNTIASVSLSDPTAASISVGTTSNPTSCNGADGTIQITGLAASTNYSFSYDKNASTVSTTIMSDGSGNYSLSGLTSGTYENFQVVSAGCASNNITGPVTLSDPNSPTITYDSDQDPASCSSTDGFIVLSSLTSGRDYQYSYTKNSSVTTGTLTADGAGKITINNLPAGTYTSVFVDDVITGCQSNVIPSLVLNPPDIQMGTVTNATTCSGTEGSIEITSLAANTAYDLDYSFDGTPVATASITANASGVYTIASLGEGAYTNIRFTNNGCVTNSLSATITEPTPATIAQGTVSNPSTCAGTDGSIQITGLAVSTSYTVNYSDDGTPVSVTIGSDGSGNLTINGLDDGTYTNISVTKDNCASNSIASIVLSDPDNPTITLGSNPEVCAGTTSTGISYSATTGSPDQYSINFDAAANTAGFVDVSDVALPAGSIPIAVGTSTAGTYNAVLTIKNSSISCTTDYNISVTINANPTITLGSSPEVCQGEISASLSYSAVSGSPDEYEIDFDATAEAQGFVDVSNITLGASPIAIAVPAGANAASYNATLKVINTTTGCESANASFIITVNEKPTITLGTNPEVCEGETSASLNYTAVSGGDQYSISFDATAQGQGFANVAATVLPSSPIAVTVPGTAAVGTYNGTINAINSTTGCVSDSKPFTIKINSTPDITLGSSPAVCMGETSATLGYSALSGGADQYSIDFDATAEGEGFVDIANAALPSSPITLTIPAAASMDVYNANLIVTNSSTGCVSSTKAITITINDNPTFTLGTNPEVCQGVTSGSLPYTVSAGSPDQYSIDFDASAESQGFADVSNIALGASPLSVTIPAAATANSYNATITFTNSSTGCASSVAAFTVTVNTIPTISLGTDPEYCEGETTGGISYSATTGSPDLYSIDFADASFTDITNQAITATPLAFAIPDVTHDGIYAATLTVSNSTTGCVSAVNNFNVVVKNTPAITSASSNPTTCNGVDGSITLSGLSDAVTYAVSYNRDGSPVSTSATPSSGDIVLSGLSEGTYTNIKVTEDGCDSNEIASITLSDPATATITLDGQNNPTTCGGSDGNIVINTGIASAVSYTVDYLFNSATVSTTLSSDGTGDITIGSLLAGQYENFKVTANGCESNELAGPINLFDPTAPTISFTDGNNSQPSTCAATDGVIAIFGVVDNTSYDYDYTYGGSAVNGTVTSETSGNELRITGLNAGTYTDVSVTITGCQSNTLESIVLNPPDISLGTTVDPTTCSGTDGSIQIVGFAANTAYNINYDLDGTAVAEFGITSDASGEFIITNLGAGAYTNITAENSGCTTSPVLSATLSDPATPTIAEGTHSNPTTCSGTDGLIQLTGLNASTAYSVSYTVDGSTTSNTLSSNASGVIEITGLGAGNYTSVTATLANCESNELSITLSDPSSPDFSLGATEFNECIGTLEATTTYTINSGSADTYSIDFDALANSHGFADVIDATLSGGNITFDIPASAEDRSYGAMVTVKNTTTNCSSNVEAVSISIGTVPTITLGGSPEVCEGATSSVLTYSATTGSPDEYAIDFDNAAFADISFTAFPSTMEFPLTIPAVGDGVYTATLLVQNTLTGCVSDAIAFNIIINENPSLTLGTNPEVCFGETSTSISYSGATGSPDQYVIDYDATAEGQGFADVAISALPSSPISLVVPAAAIPGTYNADLVITNSSTSCNSSALPFTVTVNAYPTTPTVTTQTTSDTTPEISGSADNGSNITVIVGGATYTTVATATGWTIDTGADTPVSGTFAPNTNGVNEVQVASESNNCSISDASTDELTIDTTDPIVPTVESLVTNNVNPTISGTAEPGSQITIVVGGATFIVTADAGGNWTVDTNNAPNAGTFAPNVNGSNEVQVTSEDAAGNTSVDATTLELVIDTTDPATPTVASQITNDTTPVISGTAEAGSTVTVVVGGATYTVTADGSGNWSIDTEVVTPDSGTFSPNVNGTNEVAVTSTDEAGNSSTDITTLELTIDTTDPVVPTIVFQTTNDTTPEISGTAEANSTVTVVVGGASYTVTADGSGDWSVDTGVLTPDAGTFAPNVNGSNEVSVTSTDAAGNSSTDVTSLELTIDTTDPATPTVASQITNDTTPVISGTAEAGSTVTIVVGGATYTVTADGSGNWSIDTEVVTPDSGTFSPNVNGTNEVAVTSTDTAGNSTSDTSTLELIIDTTAPAIPTVVSQTTNDTTPIITGTAEAGSTVTIVVAGATYTTTADTSGNWVINTETDTPTMGTFAPNVNGTNEVSVTSTDAAGNSSVDATTLELTIDTTPPTISVNAISVDDKINALEDNSDITITGTSSGADGQTATIVLNGVTYNPVIAAGGNWSITLTAAQAQALPEGDNTLTADVDDAAGNSATQATRTVDHDTTPPATPTVDALISNSTTPTITGTTGTGAALAAGETMEVTINGATYTVTPDASGNWSVDTSSDTPSSGTLGTFSDGNTYQVVAVVTDDAGNTATDTSTDELTIDTTPPTISVNVISVDDKINALEDNSDITITGTSSGADGQTATIVLNGVTYNPVIAAGGNWSITLTAAQAQALPEGDNTLTADVDDAAGNSATQATRTVDHDTTPPATPTVDALISNSTTPTITGTTGTGAALAAGETMEVTINGATYTVTPDASGNWSVDTSSDTPSSGTLGTFSDGNTYQVVAVVTDDAGNTATDTSTDELTIDTTPPTISVNAISVDDKINALEDNSDITITGTSSGADGQTATIVLNGVTYNPVIAAGGNWSITLTAAQAQALPEGDNTLTADVDDAAGNSATQATRTVDHDTTPPATPTVDALISNSTTPTITGTTGTGAALAAGETMEVTINGATYTVTPDASGNWSVDTSSDTPSSGTLGTFSDGNTYQVVAVVTDDAGNTATDTSTDELTIDTTPPTISVNAISVDDKINALEDNSDITITGTSSGADGQTATIVLNGVTYNPVIAAGGNWSITLTAAQAQALPEGDNTLTADVADAAGNSATQATRDIEHDSVAPTLAINVISTDDIISALEDDSPVTISGTTDAEDGQTVTVVLNGVTYTTTVSGGTWSLAVPAADAQGLPEGTSTITANVSDVAGNPATEATRDIEHDSVAPVAPTVVSQTTDDITPVISGTAEAGSTVTVVVGGATYIITADAAGSWSIDTETATPDSGTFAPDVNGTNEVQVTSTDAAGNSTTDSTTGELIIDQNDSPVASVENISTDEDIDVSGTLVDNVNDPEGQNLTFTLLTGIDPATEGTFTLNSDGTYTFEPFANFNGNLSLTYEVCDDGNPVLCDQETINITINAVNDIPVATGETLTIDEDGTGNGDLSDNVTDVEGDGLTFNLVSGPDPSTQGTVTVNPDGTYSFVPVGDFNGTVSFTYEVCDDGSPAQCSQATVTIVVNAVNDSPVPQDDVAAVDPGNSVTIPVLNNDSDLENNTLIVSQITVQPANGTVVINADGTISYTPNDGFDDGTDTFTYEVCDNGSPSLCATATVTVSVPEQELAPTAVDDSATVTEDGSVSGNVLDNDSDGNGDVLTVNTTPVSGPTSGTLILNSDGTYTYTPNPNFNGTDSFTYEVCDDATPALCSQATVTITVNASNDAPTATGETLTMDEDGTGNGDLSDNVTDLEGDDLTFSLVSGPDSATEGTVTINSDGTYTFVPVGDFNGTVTFTYEVCDNGSPVQCVQATVSVVVNAVNDSPVANDDTSTTDPGVAVVIDVIANDTDLEGNTLTVSQITAQPANGMVTINADGTVTYTPNAGFNTGTDTFTYEVCDDGSPSLCTTATVSVSVPREELAPVALDDAVSVNEDENVSGNVLDNDSDGNNDILTVNTTPVSGPTNGTLVLNADGTYTYTPDPGFSGSDSFIYEVCDNGSPVQCDQATVTITVNAVNDAPVATPETIVTDEEAAASGTLANNATDEDSANLTFALIDEPDATEGVFSLNSDGTYTFTPAENFSGTINITYEVCDDGNPALCVQETISITVNPINDAPTANDDQISQTGFAQIDGTVADLVNDADNDPLQFTALTQPGNGTLTFNTDGTYSYAPENGFFGIVTFDYQVCDDATPSECATATVTIEILSDGLDTDGDGILDTDEDLDGDGDLTNDDCDNDGTPNYLDTDPCDSDGDGLSDDLEDTNGDGDPYNDDCDNDGTPNFQDEDSCDTDGDGILDTDEDLDADGDPTNDDCDNDGTPNYLDSDPCDSDGDGLSDDLEDTNGDGDPYNDDCDNDGTPNFQDEDSCDTDGDGILDTDEDLDEDGDPTNDDCDNDGTPNYLDSDPCDSDGDGIDDKQEDTNKDGDPYNDDCDDDGIPNFQDQDVCLKVQPRKGFTPDGDGTNDFFYIRDIENYPNNTVQIFNRWGNKIFEVKGYDNQGNVWRSESSFGLIPGANEVPSGTYYYLIDLGDGSKPIAGFVVVNR